MKDFRQKFTQTLDNVSARGPDDGLRNKILSIVLAAMLLFAVVLAVILLKVTAPVETPVPAPDSLTQITAPTETPAEEPQTEASVETEEVPEETEEPEPTPSAKPLEDGDKLLAVPDGSLEEYQNAVWKHWSETMFLTISEQTTATGQTYLLTHVIIRNPSQLQLRTAGETLNENRQTLTDYAKNNNFILGINASESTNGLTQVRSGTYICSGRILQDMPASGNELCISEDGSLESAEPGTEPIDLINAGIVHSAISAGPILLSNGEAKSGLSQTNMGTKTAIAMKYPGEYYIITASDGDYISDVSYQDLQAAFLEKECQFAKCMGDGADVVLVMNGEVINNPAAEGSQRSLLDFLIFLD